GLSSFVLLNAALWGAVYGCLFGWFDASHPGPVYWWSFVATICAVAGFSVWLAWRSPHWMEVVPREELANPGSKTARPPNWMHGHARLEKTFYWLNRPRMWRCAGIAAAISFAGLYSVNSILTVYSFAEAYQLPEHGGDAVMILVIIVFVSFLPGATFLRARAQGHSHANAARVSMFMVGVVLMAAAMGGYFVQPLAVLTMRAMGVVDLTPRTYEILKVDDRAAYKALGYKPKAGDKFVEGVIAFQFADVKLICPSAFKLAPGWGRMGRKKDDPPVADLSGCLTPTKDELRVVNLPERFTPTADLSAGNKPSGR
ncbi:hypothetical protein, partial [Ralstonia pseudosolanacearum]|uniref:hypothetical protein n=2 Tax=Ralstonia pseudosolanacearum TaxID=1310165 RepID=UPI003AADC0E6